MKCEQVILEPQAKQYLESQQPKGEAQVQCLSYQLDLSALLAQYLSHWFLAQGQLAQDRGQSVLLAQLVQDRGQLALSAQVSGQ